ncbi:DUF1669 domain-containing protein [Candidatus Parvarchaeota archaeon]|nr:DUF1669 domain-containing protein [Candidatus Parvarchaeota archaeon]
MGEKLKFSILGFLAAAVVVLALIGIGMLVPSWQQVSSARAVFSPGSDDEILGLLDSAQKSIDIEMYVFTEKSVAQKLIDKAQQGVDVRVILELRTIDSGKVLSMARFLQQGGVKVRIASNDFALTHAKSIVVDGNKALIGSINFSKSALSKNREAAVIVEGNFVGQFQEIFNSDWEAAAEI